jgi:hypothetical protein
MPKPADSKPASGRHLNQTPPPVDGTGGGWHFSDS